MGIEIEAGRDVDVEAGGDVVGGDKTETTVEAAPDTLGVAVEAAKQAIKHHQQYGDRGVLLQMRQYLHDLEKAEDQTQRRRLAERLMELARLIGPSLMPAIIEIIKAIG